ncbi:MAG: Ig domain-containing protein [Bacteroidaceae bacterium]|nr:Ig domain-containing protein [Bacteroidaceae bacterium]
MKRVQFSLAALALATAVNAQVINGDLNHNEGLDVEDVTMLIDGYLTGETEVINTAVDPSLIVGDWVSLDGGKYVSFTADGATTGFDTDYNYYQFTADGMLQFMQSPDAPAVASYLLICLTKDYLAIRSGTQVEVFQPYGTNGHEYVDLGLSVNWATMNVGAAAPEEAGSYFSWGETMPKSNYQMKYYKWSEESAPTTMTKYVAYGFYGRGDGKTVLEKEDDAATQNWGGSWRMPTVEEINELLTCCTWTWDSIKMGYVVTSNINDNSIFMPAAGRVSSVRPAFEGVDGEYWTSSLNQGDSNSGSAQRLSFSKRSQRVATCSRYIGLTVRPVTSQYVIPVTGITLSDSMLTMLAGDSYELKATVEPVEADSRMLVWTSSNDRVATVSSTGVVTAVGEGSATISCKTTDGRVVAACSVTVKELSGTSNGYDWVDLGLSVRWATMNVGASAPEEKGSHFAWGEVEPKTNYYWTTYKHCAGKISNISKYTETDKLTTLEPEDDAAQQNWSGAWRMPTYEELEELRTQCTWEQSTLNGMTGFTVTSTLNGQSIFMPTTGYYWYEHHYYPEPEDDSPASCNYWSSTLSADNGKYDSAKYLYSRLTTQSWYDLARDHGLAVRPVLP